jgi:two-component system phosphate regulon sensor histidine kinase PhoR
MTHELKTPISTIALSSEVLSDPDIINEPERLRNYARIIHTENERLRQQVERVLQLATLDNSTTDLRRESVDMHAVIREVVKSFDLLMAERKGSFQLALDATIYSVTGDRVHLANALYNLVDNAVKYTKGPPIVRISTSLHGDRLRIAVADNGIGIKPEDLKHIFERFFRVHTGNVHDVKGFGLGLHYVAAIARAHGGKTTVNSKPGSGSTFTLDLPAAINTSTT